MQPVFRFAPSPNGYLHLGHAYSALLNQKLAQESGGRLLLRIEDIDTVRCRPELIAATFEDLRWLGFQWEEPVLRQSEHFDRYRAAIANLDRHHGVVYPCFCSRNAITHAVAEMERGGQVCPRDPDGAPLYPGTCRTLTEAARAERMASGVPHALRIDLAQAIRIHAEPVSWFEARAGRIRLDPAIWGDVVIARKDTPTSYHLAVVVDDAAQGVTDVVRGRDLYASTAIHRILQRLLDLEQPRYRHHDLLVDSGGQKLAKSKASTPLRELRAAGISADAVRHRLGFA